MWTSTQDKDYLIKEKSDGYHTIFGFLDPTYSIITLGSSGICGADMLSGVSGRIRMTDKQLRRAFIKFRNANSALSRAAAQEQFKKFLERKEN